MSPFTFLSSLYHHPPLLVTTTLLSVSMSLFFICLFCLFIGWPSCGAWRVREQEEVGKLQTERQIQYLWRQGREDGWVRRVLGCSTVLRKSSPGWWDPRAKAACWRSPTWGQNGLVLAPSLWELQVGSLAPAWVSCWIPRGGKQALCSRFFWRRFEKFFPCKKIKYYLLDYHYNYLSPIVWLWK